MLSVVTVSLLLLAALLMVFLTTAVGELLLGNFIFLELLVIVASVLIVAAKGAGGLVTIIGVCVIVVVVVVEVRAGVLVAYISSASGYILDVNTSSISPVIKRERVTLWHYVHVWLIPHSHVRRLPTH